MQLLSFPISPSTPMYGNSGFPEFLKTKDQSCGDSCNQMKVSFSNHTSTHLDCPYHFSNSGKKLSDYASDFWFSKFCQIWVMPEEVGCETIIGKDDLLKFVELENLQSKDVEVVLLKTGFGRRRDKKEYWFNPPGIGPDVADFLRNHFPKIKFFGFDLISLSSFSNRPLGRVAHKAFLDREDPILIVEDLNLESMTSNTKIDNILISPLLLEDADGAPCTVWANVY